MVPTVTLAQEAPQTCLHTANRAGLCMPRQVLGFVGAGAHGQVFKALWREQLVAIKASSVAS